MALIHTIFTNKNFLPSQLTLSATHFSKSPKWNFPPSNSEFHFPIHRFLTSQPHLLAAAGISDSFQEPYGASQQEPQGNGSTDFDAVLSILEFISLASSAATAALVHKNSEATQALAAQGDILEKELGEIQKVLLSMQEQQQKQLELILAIGKAGKLWDDKRVKSQDQKASKASKPVAELSKLEINKIQTMAWKKEGTNDDSSF